MSARRKNARAVGIDRDLLLAHNVDLADQVDGYEHENARLTALAAELAEALRDEMDCQPQTAVQRMRLLVRPDIAVLLDREDQAQ